MLGNNRRLVPKAEQKQNLTYLIGSFISPRLIGLAEISTLAVYVIALVAVVLTPILYDNHHAYRERQRLVEALKPYIEAISKQVPSAPSVSPQAAAEAVAKAASLASGNTPSGPQPTAATVASAANEEAKKYTGQTGQASADSNTLLKLAGDLVESPEGMTGEARLAMTLGFVVIIGIVVIQLLVMSSSQSAAVLTGRLSNQTLAYAQTASTNETDIIKTVVTILSGAVTAMVGFYFGQKSSGKSTSPASPKPAAPASPKTPTAPGSQGQQGGSAAG